MRNDLGYRGSVFDLLSYCNQWMLLDGLVDGFRLGRELQLNTCGESWNWKERQENIVSLDNMHVAGSKPVLDISAYCDLSWTPVVTTSHLYRLSVGTAKLSMEQTSAKGYFTASFGSPKFV